MNFSNKVENEKSLIVQPRMGFSNIVKMRHGLSSVKKCKFPTVGTITIDSFTRVNDYNEVEESLKKNKPLNGFPIVYYGEERVKAMVDNIQSKNFPIQVRHGSAKPFDIFEIIKKSNLDATEGGPVSYCLPYGKTKLSDSIEEWIKCCNYIAAPVDSDTSIHLETFGGCMLGQMCPPSLLLAMSILESLFFKRNGVYDISLSFTQQTSFSQDLSAIYALNKLAEKYLYDTRWHLVLYTYMGVYPKSEEGAVNLLKTSALLAKLGGVKRLIVKTAVEAQRIPTIQENIEALEHAHNTCTNTSLNNFMIENYEDTIDDIYNEANHIIEAVLNIHPDINKALRIAFEKGILDIPYCLHPDNKGKSRSYIDDRGYIVWGNTGNLPLSKKHNLISKIDPFDFLKMLSYTENKYDSLRLSGTDSYYKFLS